MKLSLLVLILSLSFVVLAAMNAMAGDQYASIGWCICAILMGKEI